MCQPSQKTSIYKTCSKFQIHVENEKYKANTELLRFLSFVLTKAANLDAVSMCVKHLAI